MISSCIESEVIEVENKIAVPRGWGKERMRVGRDYSKFNVTIGRISFGILWHGGVRYM